MATETQQAQRNLEFTLRTNTFSRTGYGFSGWNTKSDGSGTAYSDGQANVKFSVDTILYAQWIINMYTVTFKDWDNTVLKAQTVNYGGNATPPSNPSRTGYTFSSWSGTYTNVTSTRTITATYTAITYQVKFNGNESTSGSMPNQTFTYNTAQKLTANRFTRTGYTFAGWATSAGGAAEYDNQHNITTNLANTQGAIVNLYAVWSPDYITITFDSNGGS